ncbi:MAG: hypothetical protein A2580_18065 [Hydrogenophilales bacterium RIFOXYD1_FULL_62_11]|nr:MAG: hypothetical protein A2580_18065 [Hydrogenophilales bacterium RIFOXYD1_FULL_62_11]
MSFSTSHALHAPVLADLWSNASRRIEKFAANYGDASAQSTVKSVEVEILMADRTLYGRRQTRGYFPEQWLMRCVGAVEGGGYEKLVVLNVKCLSTGRGTSYHCEACTDGSMCTHVTGMLYQAHEQQVSGKLKVSVDSRLQLVGLDELPSSVRDDLWWLFGTPVQIDVPRLTGKQLLESLPSRPKVATVERRVVLALLPVPKWHLAFQVQERSGKGPWQRSGADAGSLGSVEEEGWLALLESTFPEPDNSFGAKQVALMLAAASDGRLLNENNQPVTVEEAALPLGRWESTESGIQFHALPERAQWLGPEGSIWVGRRQKSSTAIALNIVPRKVRELVLEAANWPPVVLESVPAIASLWKKKPALKALVEPVMPDLYEERLEVVPRVLISHTSTTTNVTLSLVHGEETFTPGGPVDAVVRQGAKIYRFARQPELLSRLDELLTSMGFVQFSDGQWRNTVWGDAQAWVAYRMRQVLGPDVMVQAPGAPPLTRCADDVASLKIDVEALPAKHANRRRYALTATCDGHQVTLESLMESPVEPVFADAPSMVHEGRPYELHDRPGLSMTLLTGLERIDRGRRTAFSARISDQAAKEIRRLTELFKLQGAEGGFAAGFLSRISDTSILTPRGLSLFEAWQRDIEGVAAAKDDSQAVPEDVLDTITLPAFQRQGVNWLLACAQAGYGGILADDRGLGKTVESIAVLVSDARSRQGPHSVSVVVVEPRDLSHWNKHLAAYGGDLKYAIHYGPERTRDAAELAQLDIVVTSYGIFTQEGSAFRALRPRWLFLDEARGVKSPDSVRWVLARTLADTSLVVPINGTPVDRSATDLWALIELVAPGMAGDRRTFKRIFEARKGDAFYDPKERTRLLAMIKPFVLRRQKHEIPEMRSKKVVIDQFVTMDDANAKRYEAIRARLAKDLIELYKRLPRPQARIGARTIVHNLRRHCSDPGVRRGSSTKGDYLIEMTKELLEADHSLLIFTHHNASVTRIQDRLQRVGIDSSAFYSGIKVAKRETEKARFVDGEVKVMVLSTLGASGLDLPQADMVIISDPWIKLTEEDQMGDRAHRLVSTSDVTVFNLILEGTIEEVGKKILERAQQASSDIFEGTGANSELMQLTEEDYEEMLGLAPGTLA